MVIIVGLGVWLVITVAGSGGRGSAALWKRGLIGLGVVAIAGLGYLGSR